MHTIRACAKLEVDEFETDQRGLSLERNKTEVNP